MKYTYIFFIILFILYFYKEKEHFSYCKLTSSFYSNFGIIYINNTRRFGNFIIILKNSIKLGLYYKLRGIKIINKNNSLTNINTYYNFNCKELYNIEIIKNLKEINNYDNNGICFFNLKCIQNIFYKFNPNKICNKKVNRILKEIIYKNYKFKIKQSKYDLCIHIRSGDIFVNPHPGYAQPPYDFYKKIIDSNKYNKICIISEDRKNPNIDLLLKNYPFIDFKINNLKTDIEMLLNTTNICCGTGTFVPEVLTLSYGHKKLIRFQKNYIQKIYYNNGLIIKKSKKILLQDYISEWNNTKKQLNIMLNYKINNINDIINNS